MAHWQQPLYKHLHPVIAVIMSAVLLTGCGTPSPDGPSNSYGLDLAMPDGATVNGAIIFYVDGLNAEIFQEMLVADELPAINKYFVSRGLYAPKAVGNTPSVTLANLTSFVTGLFPGHHGVTGINWFDRNRLIWRNYETIAQKNTLDGDYTAPNIYEQFPDRTTVSVFFQPHRRSTKFIENWTSAGPPFFFGWYEFVDRLTLYRLGVVAEIARKRRSWPAITVAYMLAPDFRAYAKGVKSPEYRNAIVHTDRQIGRVCGDLADAGLLDELYLVLVSDHGLGEVTKHFALDDFLRGNLGMDIADKHLWENTPFEKRLSYYEQFPAVTYGSGDRYWAICLRKPILDRSGQVSGHQPWTVRPTVADIERYSTAKGTDTINLPAELLRQEAVDAVAFSVGPDRVRLARANGEVEFRQTGGRGNNISYHLIAGDDVLGWHGKVDADLLKGQPTDPRQWLAETVDTEFPDLPAQIVAYFRARRAGDIAVFAKPGWDFRTYNRAGHGGLRPEEMHVPLVIAGPGIEPGEISTARTTDVMPTLLGLLGRSVPPNLDGTNLLSQ